MRSALVALVCLMSLPAMAECQYRKAFNYVTGTYEDAPIACTREPVISRTELNAQSWRNCPTHQEVDQATGQLYTVRVCKTNALGS